MKTTVSPTMRKWKYPVSYTIRFKRKDGSDGEFSMMTQLYQTGVYGIANNSPAMQGSFTPGQLESGWKKILKQAEKGEHEIIETGRMITVTLDDDGFYVKVED